MAGSTCQDLLPSRHAVQKSQHSGLWSVRPVGRGGSRQLSMRKRAGKRCQCSWRWRQLGATPAVILRVGWVGSKLDNSLAIVDVVIELGGRRRLGEAGVGERRNSNAHGNGTS